jgi:hypothetical protein
MQNQISELLAGATDPMSIMVMSLIAPGLLIFAILFLLGFARPRWRGYWDAV